MSDNMHTYPTTDEHITEGLDCWCSPRYLLPCDECDNGCWRCTDGLIPLSRREAEDASSALVIVHNR